MNFGKHKVQKMVYENIIIVSGVLVTADEISQDEELEQYFEPCEEFENDPNATPRYFVDDPVWHDLQVYSWPSCGCGNDKVGGRNFVIGKAVRTYHRKKYRCGKALGDEDFCGKRRTVCNECLGQTENGHYDVVKIINGVVTIEGSEMCGRCKHHKGPVKKCGKCGYKSRGLSHNKIHFWNELLDSKEMHFYVMADDCTSCT